MWDAIGSFAATAAGGGIFGSVLHIASGAFDVWRKGKETRLEIERAKELTELTLKGEAWKAFSEAQKASASASSFTVPANAAPWAASTFTAIAAFRESIRPGLTCFSMALVSVIYFTLPDVDRKSVSDEIVFATFTAFFFWFGERHERRSKR